MSTTSDSSYKGDAMNIIFRADLKLAITFEVIPAATKSFVSANDRLKLPHKNEKFLNTSDSNKIASLAFEKMSRFYIRRYTPLV